jgi:hypothetical protein
MSGKYEIDSKSLLLAIERCSGIIALGEKADANVVMIDFHKKGIQIGAQNTVATYVHDVPVKILEAGKMRVSIIPNLLLSYAKSYKTLVLQPMQDHLVITSKGFEAKMHYIGEATPIETQKPKNTADITAVADVARDVLGRVAGIKNRTDSHPLAVQLKWGKGELAVTVGDTHHAVIVDSKIKQKDSNSITTTLPNMQKIMDIGNNFALENDTFFSWSDTEYLALSTRVENMFLADMARDSIMDQKKQLRVTLNTEKFRTMVETLTNAVEETDVMRFVIAKGKMLATIKTAAGSAKAAIKVESQKGADTEIRIAVHHLRDCMSPIKEKNMNFFIVADSMIGFETKTEKTHVIAAASAMGSGA